MASQPCVCGQPAVLQCACEPSAVTMCASCLSTHIFTKEGRHKQRSLARASLCQLCNKQSAACFCSCKRLALCGSCFSAHRDVGRHLQLPLLTGSGAEKVLNTAEALLGGLEDARSAQQETISALNDLIRTIHTYKIGLLKQTTDDIKVLERVIQSAVRELSLTITQPACRPSDELQALLAMSPVEQRSKLQFATVMKTPNTPVPAAVIKSVNLFISKQLSILPVPSEPIKIIPLIEPTKVYLSPTPFTLSYESPIADLNTFAFFTAWCFLPNGNVFATGTQNNRFTVSIDCAGEFAIALADTLDVHWTPGICSVNSRVYLFGGLKGVSSPVCEMFNLHENQWDMLPDMLTPRAHFQPSVCHQFIYIFGGVDVDRAERFDLTRLCFEPLRLLVPGRHWITTYCDGDIFYLFTRTEVHRWDQRGPLQKIKEGLSVGFFSQMPPQKIGEEIYFFGRSDDDRYLMKFHLQSYKLDIALQFGLE